MTKPVHSTEWLSTMIVWAVAALVTVALLWLLGDVRARLMELFSVSRGLARPIHGFQGHAPTSLDARLQQTVAGADIDQVRQALRAALDMLEHDLADLTDGRYELSAAQGGVLGGLRRRMADA